MSVNLQKGQKVDLTKGNAGLKRIVVGLGWDAIESKGGFLGFGKSKPNIDCDASAFLCGANGKLTNQKDVIYFGNLQHSNGCVQHLGDNLTGDGDGDDEQIVVDLQNTPSTYEKIVFVVNIYESAERKQHFGMIRNAFIRLVDANTKKELCRYNLSDSYDGMTAMIFGEIYRHNGEWKFNALGQGTQDAGLGQLAAKYS